jgi:hypothetical protein
MSFLRPGSGWRHCEVRRCATALALTSVLALGLIARAQAAPVLAAGNGRSVSLEDYRKHLETLDRLVTSCQKQRNREACDPAQVGPDERVPWATSEIHEEREIRYGWLRLLLNRAATKEEPAADAVKKSKAESGGESEQVRPLPVDALLTQARERLAGDWKQAGDANSSQPRLNRAAERKSLNAILARREYQGVSESSFKDRLQEKLANWINDFFRRMAGYGSRSPWIAFALRALFVVAICLGLAWALIQMERRSRIRLVPELSPSPGAPSARTWQLWLQDAHQMAAQGLWREAIHFVYWASISRLESRRLWPADRARTPREYLALLASEDPRRANLTALTRSFERTWYGGREAGSSDFQAALRLAAELGVE